MLKGISELSKLIQKGISAGAADALAAMNGLSAKPAAERPAEDGTKDLSDLIVSVPCMNCGASTQIYGPRFQDFVDNHEVFPCPACNSLLDVAQYAEGLNALTEEPTKEVIVGEEGDDIVTKLANKMLKGLDPYPTKEEIERSSRIMTAKSMEDEAKVREIYGDPETRAKENALVLREWGRIKADQDKGLSDEDVWSNHLDRMNQIAHGCSDSKKTAQRAAHFELEGLTTAASMLRDRAKAIQSGSTVVTKSFSDLSRLAIGGSWLRKAVDEDGDDYADLMDDFILEMIDAGVDLEDIDYYTTVVSALMMKAKAPGAESMEKSWKWQRKDGSWWMTDPEGGKPIPYRPGMTLENWREKRESSRQKKLSEGKDIEASVYSPENSYAKLDKYQQNRVDSVTAQLKTTKGVARTLEGAYDRVTRVNYMRKDLIPEEVKNNQEWLEANKEVGKLAGIAKAYVTRAMEAPEGSTEKKFWTSIALTMTEEAEHQSHLRLMSTYPFFTTGQGAAPDIRGNIDTFVIHQAHKWIQNDIKKGLNKQQIEANMVARANKILNQMTSPIKALSRAQAYEAMGLKWQAEQFHGLHKVLMAMSPAERKQRWINMMATSKTTREEKRRQVEARKAERAKERAAKTGSKPAKAPAKPKEDAPKAVSEPKKVEDPVKTEDAPNKNEPEPKKEEKKPEEAKAPKEPKSTGIKPTKTTEDVKANTLKNLLSGSEKYHDFDVDALNAIRDMAHKRKNMMPADDYDSLFEEATAEIKRQNRGIFGGDSKKKAEDKPKEAPKQIRPKFEEPVVAPKKAPAAKKIEAPKKTTESVKPEVDKTPTQEAPVTIDAGDDDDLMMMNNIIDPKRSKRVLGVMDTDTLEELRDSAGKYYDGEKLNLKQYQSVIDAINGELKNRG